MAFENWIDPNGKGSAYNLDHLVAIEWLRGGENAKVKLTFIRATAFEVVAEGDAAIRLAAELAKRGIPFKLPE